MALYSMVRYGTAWHGMAWHVCVTWVKGFLWRFEVVFAVPVGLLRNLERCNCMGSCGVNTACWR